MTGRSVKALSRATSCPSWESRLKLFRERRRSCTSSRVSLACWDGRPDPGRAPPQFGLLTFSSGILELCPNHLERALINLNSWKSKNGSRKKPRQDASKQTVTQISHLCQEGPPNSRGRAYPHPPGVKPRGQGKRPNPESQSAASDQPWTSPSRASRSGRSM